METLSKLQKWYASQCNDDWEHSYGIIIETLDNPGWKIDIDLEETNLKDRAFKKIESKNFLHNNDDWLSCHVENNKFLGCGDPSKLEKIISIFLEWAEN